MEVTEPAEPVVRCPNCGRRDVRRSYARGSIDLFMRMFSRNPFRCRSCGKRFYRFVPRHPEASKGLAE
jgi:hypothetical protein